MKIGSKRTLVSTALSLVLATSLPVLAKDKEEKEEAKWDVSTPTGQVKSVNINTTESTWSNLDVHPNGKSIIFDMLGDLYTIPISAARQRH